MRKIYLIAVILVLPFFLISCSESDNAQSLIISDDYDKDGTHRYYQKNGAILILNNSPGKYDFCINKDNKWTKIENLKESNKIEIVNSLIKMFGSDPDGVDPDEVDPEYRWGRMELYLLNQDDLLPRIGFYYATVKDGLEDGGTAIVRSPICLLLNDDEILILNENNNKKIHSEKINDELSKRADELLKANVIPFRNYGDLYTHRSAPNELRREAIDDLQSKVVEWTVLVKDIIKQGEIYIIKTASPNDLLEYTPNIYLIPKNIEEREMIESFNTDRKIKVRGHVFHKDERSDLCLQPAILIDEPGIAKSELVSINVLQKKESSEAISLKSIVDKLSKNLTALQTEKIIKENTGKIVDFKLDDYPGCKLIGLTNSFACFVGIRDGFDFDILADITCQNDSQYELLQKYEGQKNKYVDNIETNKRIESKIQLRGKIRNISRNSINIDPCILHSDDLHRPEGAKNELESQNNQPTNEVR